MQNWALLHGVFVVVGIVPSGRSVLLIRVLRLPVAPRKLNIGFPHRINHVDCSSIAFVAKQILAAERISRSLCLSVAARWTGNHIRCTIRVSHLCTTHVAMISFVLKTVGFNHDVLVYVFFGLKSMFIDWIADIAAGIGGGEVVDVIMSARLVDVEQRLPVVVLLLHLYRHELVFLSGWRSWRPLLIS